MHYRHRIIITQLTIRSSSVHVVHTCGWLVWEILMKNKGWMTRRDSTVCMGFFTCCKKVKFWDEGGSPSDSTQRSRALFIADLQMMFFWGEVRLIWSGWEWWPFSSVYFLSQDEHSGQGSTFWITKKITYNLYKTLVDSEGRKFTENNWVWEHLC